MPPGVVININVTVKTYWKNPVLSKIKFIGAFYSCPLVHKLLELCKSEEERLTWRDWTASFTRRLTSSTWPYNQIKNNQNHDVYWVLLTKELHIIPKKIILLTVNKKYFIALFYVKMKNKILSLDNEWCAFGQFAHILDGAIPILLLILWYNLWLYCCYYSPHTRS